MNYYLLMKWLFTLLFLNNTFPGLENVCLNSGDQKIWDSYGQNDFKTYMTNCGKQCDGNKDCTTKCVQKNIGYSEDCSECFGAIGECSVKNCFLKCMGGDSPTCEQCIASNCDNSFYLCCLSTTQQFFLVLF